MLALARADVDGDGDWRFERRQFGTSPSHLQMVAEWLVERDVKEVVMESTAQYWRPVWDALERNGQSIRRPGSIFELVYRRLVVHLGHAQAIGAIAHRLCRLVWKILHDGAAYEERDRPSPKPVPSAGTQR